MHKLFFMGLLALVLHATAFAQSRDSEYALGLASNTQFVRSADTALTGIYYLNNGGMVQGFFLLSSSDPTLYGMGASYKATVVGDAAEGLHLGGGLGFGSYTQGKTFLQVNGIAGFHFGLSKRVSVHVDGGISMGQVDSRNQFFIGGQSSLFGISLLYRI